MAKIAIRSRSHSAETLIEILNSVEKEELSTTAQGLVNKILEDPDKHLDDGVFHESWEHGEPCPECGSRELFVWSLVDDLFIVDEDGTHMPIDNGYVHGNPMTQCSECNTVLYRQAGLSVL